MNPPLVSFGQAKPSLEIEIVLDLLELSRADGLQASKLHGFCCRATHNLWVVLEENRWLTKHIARGTYRRCYDRRLDNSVYRPLIDELLALDAKEKASRGQVRFPVFEVGNGTPPPT
ncbi:MAG: hypothetical protein ACLQOO_08015 [Terriglobia bacterium]